LESRINKPNSLSKLGHRPCRPDGQAHRLSLRRLFLRAALLGIISAWAESSWADDRLKDFQNAINYMQDDKGCLSIPYPSRQEACQRKQADVNRWCKESGPWSCENADPKAMQKDIELLKTEREGLKDQLEKLKQRASSLTSDQDKRDNEDQSKETERKLYELERKRQGLEHEVADSTKSVNDRYYVAKSCLAARTEVQDVFKDAKSSANSEGDADIAPLAKRLAQSWEQGEQKHQEAIKGAAAAVNSCEKTLYDIGHLGSF
jgi:hypothetical protein